MKSVLVTGGLGYIGSQLAKKLASKYPQLLVTILDRGGEATTKILEELQKLDNVQIFRGDVRSVDLVRHLLVRTQCDLVVHLAAITECTKDNLLEFTKINTIGTHVLLELCYHLHLKFVLVSTDGVYGTSELDENTLASSSSSEKAILNPSSPYAAAHAAAEMMTRAYHRSYNLNCNVVRLSNVYGPRQPAQKVIPNFILSILMNREVCIHGDGSSKRNYLYIEDALRALDSVMHMGIPGEIYNIASRDNCSVMDLMRDICAALGKNSEDVKYKHVANRDFNDVRFRASEKKISNSLGWEQTIHLKEGLKLTTEWYKQHAISFWGSKCIEAQMDSLQNHHLSNQTT